MAHEYRSSKDIPVKLTEFSRKVMALVKKIPKGKVATYGQIAALAGKPHGARGVGWILHSSTRAHDLPWQRVLNSKGRISFDSRSAEFKEQKKLLVSEGIRFSDGNQIDLDRFQWKKRPPQKRRSPKTPSLFSDD
jgi:methylated-DNA-protein-cysteine methyltransferase-like protein